MWNYDEDVLQKLLVNIFYKMQCYTLLNQDLNSLVFIQNKTFIQIQKKKN